MKAARALPLLALAAGASSLPAGCSHSTATPSYLSEDAMLDPQTCVECHMDHYNDWSGSMHAYASDDPVFLAMNARGQRETNGQLGTFCVNCHAPMAVRQGATTDGLNLSTVPQKLKGVTCFFCHTINAVTGAHNAAVSLSGDTVMRGEYSNPLPNAAHASTYDVLHDRDVLDSAGLCGACHDIVSPLGGAIERTFAEWQSSAYDQTSDGNTCGQCHMPESTSETPIAQVQGAPPRRTHAHDFPAVDVALTPAFPNAAAESAAVIQQLGSTLQSALCVTEEGAIRVLLDNVAAGHSWPSGAAQDRRAWAEVIATKAGSVMYQSGVVPDGTPVTSVTNDPDLWLMRDCMFNAATPPAQVDMFWQAATYEGNEMPVPVTFDPSSPDFYLTHVVQFFPRNQAPLPEYPDQVTLRVRLQPIGLDVLDDLVSTNDLDASVADAMSTFDVMPLLTWTPAVAAAANLQYLENQSLVSCVSATSFNVGATKNPATNHVNCSP